MLCAKLSLTKVTSGKCEPEIGGTMSSSAADLISNRRIMCIIFPLCEAACTRRGRRKAYPQPLAASDVPQRKWAQILRGQTTQPFIFLFCRWRHTWCGRLSSYLQRHRSCWAMLPLLLPYASGGRWLAGANNSDNSSSYSHPHSVLDAWREMFCVNTSSNLQLNGVGGRGAHSTRL